MKITKIVAIRSHKLLDRKAAFKSGKSAACAESSKIPKPNKAKGTVVSHNIERFELNPRILLKRSMGPLTRLAS